MNLPAGWTQTVRVDGHIITWPDHGSVTVDARQRGFALGYDALVWPKSQYTGRGWRDRLYADAIKALQEVFWEEVVAPA